MQLLEQRFRSRAEILFTAADERGLSRIKKSAQIRVHLRLIKLIPVGHAGHVLHRHRQSTIGAAGQSQKR